MNDDKINKYDLIYKKPWGYYILHTLSEVYQVKEICLANKQDCFSYHFHKLVDEIWYIKKGHVHVVIGEFSGDAEEGKVFLIPKGYKHSLINIGTSNAVIVELQIGRIDHNDVFRLEDKYGRANLLRNSCHEESVEDCSKHLNNK